MQIADRALVRIAGICPPDARRISDHRLELLAHLRLGIRNQDRVAVALRHLAAVGAGEFGRRRKQNLWLGQHWTHRESWIRWLASRDTLHSSHRSKSGGIELVESPRHFPREFDVRHLVLADGNKLRLIEQNVCCLQQWVSEKTVGAQIFSGQILLLLFISGHTFEPAKWCDHGKKRTVE